MGEMETDDSWSLIAVVKECARKVKLRDFEGSSPTTTTTTVTVPEVDHLGTNRSYSQNSFFNQVVPEHDLVGYTLPSAAGAATAAPAADYREIEDELRDLYKSFLIPHPPPVISTVNAESAAEGSGNLPVEQNSQQQQQLHLRDFQINPKQSSSSAAAADHDQCFQKKRKFEDRRVVRVTLEDLSRYDKWAWRKYGQKPIKGSPYPRNYYRCSSTKGCKARKQVERSPVDPIMYIVTYTDHHQHPCPPIRNSGGHRVKYSGSKSNPPPEIKYPTSTLAVPVKLEYGYGYGYEYGYVPGGDNAVKIEDKECIDGDGGRAGDHECFGCGIMDEGSNGHEILIPKSMLGSDLLSGMEQLSGGGKDNSCTTNQYKGNVGFNEMLVYNRGCDPNVKTEVQLKGNGLGCGVGIREMYASAPATLAGAHETPSNMVQNIWDNGMIRPQAFLF